MTNLQKDNNHVTVNKIIRTLSHMGRVEYRISEKMVGFYKNSKLFGKIENGVIYLLDSLGQLKKLGTNWLKLQKRAKCELHPLNSLLFRTYLLSFHKIS